MKLQYKHYAIISFAIVLIIFLFLALNSNKFYFRLDLSRDRAFSISDYSKELLRSLPDEVELTYYLSDRLQTRLPAVEEISDLLYEYQRLSRGMLRVEIIDPDSDPRIVPEDLGISPRELQIVENNEQTYALVYSGISLTYRDTTEIIPLIVNSGNLEYEITSRVLVMTEDHQPSLALLIAKEDFATQGYQTMQQYLSQYYNINPISPGDPIPPTVDALLIFGSALLDEADLYVIEQFILSGKGVFFGIESADVNINQGLTAIDQSDSLVFELLASYGVEVGKSWVLDEYNLLIPVQQQQGRVLINTYQPYPYWVQVQGEQANPDHPLSTRFQGLDLFWVSPLQIHEDLRRVDILFSSTGTSVTSEDYSTDPSLAQSLVLNAGENAKSETLAVSLRDGLTAWFSDAPETLTERGITYEDPLVQSDESRLVIFGDSDFASDLYQIGNSTYNILLLQSIVEYLVGDEELLDIRTRGLRNTRLDALSEEQVNSVLVLARVLSFGFIPGSIVLFAIIRHSRRRKRSKQAFENFAELQNKEQ